MGYLFKPYKHPLQVGDRVEFNNMTWVVVERVRSKKYRIVHIDYYSLYLDNLRRGSYHTGRALKYVKYTIKDVRELRGCEIW